MTTHNDIWVFIEQEDGKIADVSLELLAKARKLAQQLQSAVCGVVYGHRIESLAEPIIPTARIASCSPIIPNWKIIAR